MKKLILASGSAQRKTLLKNLGVKFIVRPSSVDEIQSVQTTVSALVKDNARLKAEDIAARYKEGVVIGADTVVYAGNKKIIGKPKSYKEARQILKLLFSKPQWVYTGVVVIDIATNKRIIDYEKTRVHMLPLTDEEIKTYHSKVNPFDKAGGFDIEGWGSIFIHRIEGCYSNVIGLPMSKLATMLKKVGVSILSVLMLCILSGCATEYNLATGKEETLMYGTDKEVNIGRKVSQSVERRYKINTDVDINERIEKIFERIVAVSDRRDIVYFIKIIDEEDVVNAVSLPGGYVYLFKGLLDKLENDDQIAGVIAHEVGHITAKHGIKRLQASYGAMLLQIASTQANGNVAGGLSFALQSLFLEYSQKAEFESDRLAVKYTKKAGYDPNEMLYVLKVLKEENDKSPLRQYSYWRTHPFVSQRIAVVNEAITGKLEYRDYLKLIDSY